MQLYEFKSKKAMRNILDFTAELHEPAVDIEESEKKLNFCTKPGFIVCKSVNSYAWNSWNLISINGLMRVKK